MRLFAKCQHCKREFSFFSRVADRGELAKTKGKFMPLKCNKCQGVSELHVDDIYAKRSNLAFIIALSIFLLGYVAILLGLKALLEQTGYVVYSGLFLLPIIVYGIIHKQDQGRVLRFNSFKAR